MEKKKIFEYPEALIVEFNADDIILTSGDVGVWWGGKDGDEFWDDQTGRITSNPSFFF